jgi:hypothetical protein
MTSARAFLAASKAVRIHAGEAVKDALNPDFYLQRLRPF